MKLRIHRLSVLLGLLWLLNSCSTNGPESEAKTSPLTPSPPAAAVNYSVPSSAGPDELARQAVTHHPSIIAAKHKAERLAAKVPQERALPDPTAEFGVRAMAETTAGDIPM